MYTNKARIDAYDQALQRVVNESTVVLDIGAGTGIFSFLACKYGAKQVIAVEPDDAIHVAQEIALANGLAKRIHFHQQLSMDLKLEQPADVIISDLSGTLPFFDFNIPSIIDARQRLLAPGGVLIAKEDTLKGVVAELPRTYASYSDPWLEDVKGFDMRAGRRYVFNSWNKPLDDQITSLTGAATLATLNYYDVQTPDLASKIEWTVTKPGTGHGLVIWFDRMVAPGIHISNAPEAPIETNTSKVYGRAFMPWEEAETLDIGDVISCELRADLVGDGYIWSWSTLIQKQGSKEPLAFKQSSVLGEPISPSTLRKTRSDYHPLRNAKAAADLLILEMMTGDNSLSQIAAELSLRFPGQFSSPREALTKAGKLSRRYSR